MATNTLNTKIALLYKSYADWDAIKSTYIPLKGEVCFCEVPASTGISQTEPCVLFKVGNGTSTFAALPWASALAADVYSWAKKANLDWNDLSSTFLASLDARIAEKSANTEYQMTGADGVWKLQKREIGTSEWTDVSTVDVAAYVTPLIAAEQARAEAVEANKTTQELTNANGKSQILNEADGGGIFFVKTDGTSKSFVGVNDSTAGGPDAQIYAINPANNNYGAKLDILKSGIYYTVGSDPYASRITEANEIVTRKDLAGGLHYIGSTTLATGETYAQAIARLMTEKSHTPASGDIVIIKSSDSDKEFIYDGSNWVEIGDQGLYATKAELQAETTRATTAEAGKLDILPGDEHTGGNAYNLPYYFYTVPSADKVEVHTKTVTLDGQKTYGDYSLDVTAATQSTAGLMNATDKAKLDNFYAKDLTQATGDVLILNCNY